MTATDVNAIRQAALSAELQRLNISVASRAWIVWIIGPFVLLVFLLLFAMQKATQMPFFSVLGMDTCTHAEKKAGDVCTDELTQFSSSQRNIARIMVVLIVLGIIGFLYKIYERGPVSGLLGGEAGKVAGIEALPEASAQVLSTQLVANAAMENARKQMQTTNAALPTGTTHTAHVPTSQMPHVAPSTMATSYAPAAAMSAPMTADAHTNLTHQIAHGALGEHDLMHDGIGEEHDLNAEAHI